MNTPKDAGTQCANNTKVCDGAGKCVACVKGGDCSGTDICVMNQCVPKQCSNGVKDPNETAVDCGGPCPGCPDGDPCNDAGDCSSGVCTADVCGDPTCNDGVKNGSETDVDCGGTCAPCADRRDVRASTATARAGVCIAATVPASRAAPTA